MIRPPPRSPLFPSTPLSRPPLAPRPLGRELEPRRPAAAPAHHRPVVGVERRRPGGDEPAQRRGGAARVLVRAAGGRGGVGRAAWRGRGEISGGAVSFKKKKKEGQRERRIELVEMC